MKNLDCKSFMSRLDDWMADALPPAESEQMQQHMASCDACRAETEWRKSLIDACAGLDEDVQEPEACRQAWQSAIRREANKPKTHSYRWMTGVAACLAVWLGLTGILRSSGMLTDTQSPSAANRSASEIFYEKAYDYGAASKATAYSLSADGATDSGDIVGSAQAKEQKIIRTANRTIETTAYDSDLASLNDLVAEYDATFENKNESGRSISEDGDGRTTEAVIRVPTDSLDNFLKSLVAVGTTVQSSDSASDVSSNYYDTETRLASLRTQLTRLREMYSSAQDTTDILAIDERIREVEYEIDSLEGTLNSWDSQISYSTVYVTLSEVAESNRLATMGSTLNERIAKSFKDSINALVGFFQDALVVLAMIAPQLVIWIPALLILYLIYRLIRRAVRKHR